jgi:hypothetical protein
MFSLSDLSHSLPYFPHFRFDVPVWLDSLYCQPPESTEVYPFEVLLAELF